MSKGQVFQKPHNWKLDYDSVLITHNKNVCCINLMICKILLLAQF